MHIPQRKAQSVQQLGTGRAAGARHVLQQAAESFTGSTRRKGASPGELLTVRTVLEHVARLVGDAAAMLQQPLRRYEALELRRQLSRAARDLLQSPGGRS